MELFELTTTACDVGFTSSVHGRLNIRKHSRSVLGFPSRCNGTCYKILGPINGGFLNRGFHMFPEQVIPYNTDPYICHKTCLCCLSTCSMWARHHPRMFVMSIENNLSCEIHITGEQHGGWATVIGSLFLQISMLKSQTRCKFIFFH